LVSKSTGASNEKTPLRPAVGTHAASDKSGGHGAGLRPGSPGKPKLPPVMDDKLGRAKSPTQTEDILNSILPPRY
jgi:dynein light intermediate chain